MPGNRPRSIADPNFARGRTYLHLGAFHPDDARNVVTGRTIKESDPFVIQFSSNCLDTGTWYVTSNVMVVSHDYVHPEHVLKINYKGREGDVCVSNKIYVASDDRPRHLWSVERGLRFVVYGSVFDA